MSFRLTALLIFLCSIHVAGNTQQKRSIQIGGTNKLVGVGKIDAATVLRDRMTDALVVRRSDEMEFSPSLSKKEPDSNTQGIKTLLARQKYKDRVTTPGDGPGTQGEALNEIGVNSGVSKQTAADAIQKLGAATATTCTESLNKDLASAQRAVEAIPVDASLADDRLYRLIHKLEGYKKETPESLAALRKLEEIWRAMLTSCFEAPSEQKEFKRISSRIGAFSVPNRAPFCTGTLLEDGRILTARHCFVERVSGNAIVPNVTDLVFSLADGSAILPITMGDALKAVLSPYTAFDDWVIIRAPLTNKNLAKFDLNERVLAFVDAAKSNVAPTMLDAFTVIPLAAALDAKKFPKSIVAHGNCIVAYQRDRCITHLCSAVPGGSGASLFARGTDAPSWVGIHIGPESAEISCSGNGDSISANIALRSSAQLRTHFNTKDAPK